MSNSFGNKYLEMINHGLQSNTAMGNLKQKDKGIMISDQERKAS